MKKLFFITTVIIAIMTTSCSKTEDFFDPKDLAGTTWRCSDFSSSYTANNYEYEEYKFISTTQNETWLKSKNASAKKIATTKYTVKDKTITIFYGDNSSITGNIDNKTMTFTISGGTYTFKKQ